MPEAVIANEPKVERKERGPVNLRGYAVLDDGSMIDIRLLDLSYDGCGIETGAELKRGQHLKLSLLRRGGIDAEVRWYKDGKAGLVFEQHNDSKRGYWPRRSTRLPISGEVSTRAPGKHQYKVNIFDISPHGCKIECVERPRLDDKMWVRFDGLQALEGQICWIEGFHAGVEFTNAMHPAVFELLVRKLTAKS